MRWLICSVTAILLLTHAAQAQAQAQATQTRAPAPADKSVVKVETFARGLVHPWGLQFLPDGRLLVTERDGRLRLIGKDGALSPPVAGVPKVAATGQGGLLDVALDPQFAAHGLVYLTYAEPREGGLNGTAVARGRLITGPTEASAARLADVAVIFRQQPAASGGLHFGSRLAFADDGTLFVTLGERYQRDQAQNLARHFGKVVRIAPDGTFPADNPDFGQTAEIGRAHV